ncbi:MAG: MOSC domain-containing protein [Candidatus Thermoplasmatota archaeon]|nr:MOSC domain-containing protein [Candidatus Thermoplasmatota archaeon]|tara:strand:- start:336 stop:812 length:477 start_codon:yes stop_codon:yes gene_type:complete
MNGLVHSINISSGGVPKRAVDSVNIGKEGVEGDFNRFRDGRGGDPDRAVCIFSLERIEDLKEEGNPIEVGSTGENLTIQGIEWSALVEGTKLEVGDVVLELSEPCAPCSKISESFIGGRFSRVDHKQAFGWSRWLARVVREGSVSVGDSVNIVITPKQ